MAACSAIDLRVVGSNPVCASLTPDKSVADVQLRAPLSICSHLEQSLGRIQYAV